MRRTFKTKITEMLGIEHPILCGGMQSISTADFVSKVCNAGGLGFITAETFETPDHLRDELRKMSSLTDKPFGVNISLIPEFDVGERTLRFVDVVCEEGVRVIETAGQSPEFLLSKTKEAGVNVIHKCTSVRHAVLHFDSPGSIPPLDSRHRCGWYLQWKGLSGSTGHGC